MMSKDAGIFAIFECLGFAGNNFEITLAPNSYAPNPELFIGKSNLE